MATAATSPASEFHFYEDTFRKLTEALNTYVTDVATSIIGAITDVAYTLLLIYVMLWGWSTIRGMISEPVMDGAVRVIRLTVIVSIALNLGLYNAFVTDSRCARRAHCGWKLHQFWERYLPRHSDHEDLQPRCSVLA
jgi:type IV secretory pathway VirB6-like protein